MSRHIEGGLLDPLASKVAMMRAAGMSLEGIGFDCGCSSETIKNIVSRPEVARKIIVLESIIGRVTQGSLLDLDASIQSAAHTAFEVEKQAMVDLVSIGDRNIEVDDTVAIKAITAASATAQDILDRAGKRAPTVVKTQRATGQIPQAVLDNLGIVLDEMKVTVDVTETK